MKASDFVSCPDDLQPAAIAHGETLEKKGWRVAIEPYNLAYPRTPVFVAQRRGVTRYVEVLGALEPSILEDWVGYAKSMNEDSRLEVVIAGEMPGPVDIGWLKGLGIGLVIGEPYLSVCNARDLALGIQLPSLPPEFREGLGEAYDLFEAGEWREGFEAAATFVEQEARDYLWDGVSRGRVTFVNGAGNAVTYTQARIRRLTLGQLGTAFEQVETPNQADSRIADGLKRINPDRVTAVHLKGKVGDRLEALRRNVGQHMFVVVAVLRQIHGL